MLENQMQRKIESSFFNDKRSSDMQVEGEMAEPRGTRITKKQLIKNEQ